MTCSETLREQVAAQLMALSTSGHPLDTASEASTWVRYASDVHRRYTRQQVILRYLDRQTPVKEGRSAIVTAGPPGAGKSTMLELHVPDLGGFRLLDADIVKEYLIEEAIKDGIYDDLLARKLADGSCVAPGELAPLVHRESTFLIDIIRRICLGSRENIVVEGTLAWASQGPDVFHEIEGAGYSSIQVLAVEVAPEIAHSQALSRWWEGRTKWIAGDHKFGGRFISPAVIDNCYPDPPSIESMSSCGEHAMQLIDLAQTGSIPSVRVTIFSRTVDGTLEPTTTKEYAEE